MSNAPESRAALIRRMYHAERCGIGEIALFLRCCPSDVRWALGIASDRAHSAHLRRRLSRWIARSPAAPGPLTPSIGLQVRA